ncbi:MAG: hypothetical protein ACOH2L_16390 [Devosia sp.]
MAKSATERTREFRERKKAALENAPDLTLEFMRRPFSEFLDDRAGETDFEASFDFIGIELKGSLFDEVQNFETEGHFDEPFSGNSLDRMTGVAGIMMDSAREFYSLISRYKLEEIDARIAEIEKADLDDLVVKKKALADIVTLTHMRAQLKKEFRRSFPEINVKGTPSD